MPEAPEHTALYRLYGADGALLYIGITRDPKVRWQRHGMFQGWWCQVSRKEVTWLDRRAEAKAAEERAIRAERPRHNGTHNYPLAPFDPARWPAITTHGRKQAALVALIRSEVDSGRWNLGHKIPTCRTLALATGISHHTAVLAVQALQSDGTLQFRHGFGVFVARASQQ